MKQILLDTSVLITHTELYAGKSVWQKKEAQRDLEKILSGLEIIIPNPEVSKLAGKIRARYKVNLLDALIAAEAITSPSPPSNSESKGLQEN